MPESDDHAAARAAIAQDAAEVTSRDETSWQTSVEAAQAANAHTRANAQYARGKAATWLAFASLLRTVHFFAWVAAFCVAMVYVTGALR